MASFSLFSFRAPPGYALRTTAEGPKTSSERIYHCGVAVCCHNVQPSLCVCSVVQYFLTVVKYTNMCVYLALSQHAARSAWHVAGPPIAPETAAAVQGGWQEAQGHRRPPSLPVLWRARVQRASRPGGINYNSKPSSVPELSL